MSPSARGPPGNVQRDSHHGHSYRWYSTVTYISQMKLPVAKLTVGRTHPLHCTVVIMFLVCQLPTAATLIYNIFTTPSTNEEALLRGLGNIFNCLVGLNAACNFLLYCALSDKYRKTFLLTICRCFYRDTSFDCGQSDDRRATRGSPSPTIAATNRKRPAQNTADNNRLALPNRKTNSRLLLHF